jgi:Rod binding domain-containing protein
MEIVAPHRPINATAIPLERLATHPQLSESEKIGELSRQFEAVLLRQILRQARKTVIPSDLTRSSAVSDIYDDMVTSQLAETMSRAGSFGLGRLLAQELTRRSPQSASANVSKP